MNAMQQLLTEHMTIWTAAETEKKSGRGRASGNAGSVYGIKKLRELILELAVRGKLVPQDPQDEPASELLKRIQTEKVKLIGEGKLKKEKLFSVISEDEKPFELPQRWEWVKLGEVLEMLNGRAFKPTDWISIGLPIVRIQNLNNSEAPFNYCDENNVDDRHIINSGSFLISWSGTPGTSFGAFIWNGRKAALNQHIFSCFQICNPYFDKFLELAINTRLEELISKAHGGVGLQHVTKGKLEALTLVLPSLKEQHRIVAKVDELMALCDQLEAQHSNAAEAHEKLVSHLLGTLTQSQSVDDFSANWQRIAAHFDTLFTTEVSIDALKQTLLQLAVMGKLVPQDANDEPASELLKRIQAEKAKLVAEGKIKKDKPLAAIGEDEKPFELPHGWEWARLERFVLSISSGGTPSKNNSQFWNGNIPWASVKDLNVEKYLETTQDFISEEGLLAGSKLANKGDLIICTRMGLGKIAIAAIEVAINQDLKALKVTSLLDIDYFINFYSTLKIIGSGMTVAGIRQDELLGYLVPTPPLAEQHRIVTKVNELMILCDQLKTRIIAAKQLQQKLADVMVEQVVA